MTVDWFRIFSERACPTRLKRSKGFSLSGLTFKGSLVGRSPTQRVGTNNHIVDLPAVEALDRLVEYANRFHHDTNQAWESEQINDGELQGFVRQALEFVKP